jgi:3-oxoacyl-[acyl-carrier-protein] synthase II
VLGFGMSADAYHMTSPLEDGSGGSKSAQAALADAGINPDQVPYVNAHGTSTPQGDVAEVQGIKRTFGEHAKKLVVNSTKSLTGHLLGGAGGLESVFTVLAIHNQVIPPTINLFNQDPACDLDFCANAARSATINYALKNSFGFGGTNGSLLFGKV